MKNILKKFKDEDIPNPKIFLAEITDCFSRITEESHTLLKSLIEVQSKLSLGEPMNFEISKDEFVSHDPGIHEHGQIDILLNKSVRQNLIREQQEREFNRRVLLVLTDVVKTLSRQSLAFRGAGETENDGNVKQIVNLLSRHNPVLKRWLDETSSQSHQVTYLSGESQNEFIQLLGKKARDYGQGNSGRTGLLRHSGYNARHQAP